MNSKDFVIRELRLFVEKFPQTRVRYEFDERALTHVIEIVPKEVYHLSNEYILWEDDLFDRFVAAFPLENICFVSDDALVGIANPIITIFGRVFNGITYSQDENMFVNGINYNVAITPTSIKSVENLTFDKGHNVNLLEGIYYSFPQAA